MRRGPRPSRQSPGGYAQGRHEQKPKIGQISYSSECVEMSRNRYTEAADSATVVAGKLSNSLAYPPRAMRLEQAAAYLSISTSSFLRLVDEGRCRSATKKHAMALWDRLDLDAAFEDWKTAPAERTRCTSY